MLSHTGKRCKLAPVIQGKEEVKGHVQAFGFGIEKDGIIQGENQAQSREHKPPCGISV